MVLTTVHSWSKIGSRLVTLMNWLSSRVCKHWRQCGFEDGKISPASEVHPFQSPSQVLVPPFIWANFNQGFWRLPSKTQDVNVSSSSLQTKDTLLCSRNKREQFWSGLWLYYLPFLTKLPWQAFRPLNLSLHEVKLFQVDPGFSSELIWSLTGTIMGKLKHLVHNFLQKTANLPTFPKSSCLRLCKESETVSIHLC